MENEDNSIEETLTQDTEAEIEIDLDDNQEDDTIDWKAVALKNQKAYRDQKTRAEIAEKKANTAKPQAHSESKELSFKDGFALSKANVHEDDIDEVIEYSQFKKISVAEALKSSVIVSMMKEKEEFRNSDKASTTTNTRRATPKITDDTILENARKGKVDDTDEGIKALFRARMGLK